MIGIVNNIIWNRSAGGEVWADPILERCMYITGGQEMLPLESERNFGENRHRDDMETEREFSVLEQTLTVVHYGFRDFRGQR